jgi:hypothetical protein
MEANSLIPLLRRRVPLAVFLLALLVLVLELLPRSNDPDPDQGAIARAFASTHYQRCMRADPAPGPLVCSARTIQLASALHGQKFADEVAAQLQLAL